MHTEHIPNEKPKTKGNSKRWVRILAMWHLQQKVNKNTFVET